MTSDLLEEGETFLGTAEESADDADEFMPLGTLHAAVASLTNRNPARVRLKLIDHGDGERTAWVCEI